MKVDQDLEKEEVVKADEAVEAVEAHKVVGHVPQHLDGLAPGSPRVTSRETRTSPRTSPWTTTSTRPRRSRRPSTLPSRATLSPSTWTITR